MTNPTPHGQVPEALRLAEILEGDYCPDWFYEQGVDEVSAELRRLHAYCQELEAQVIRDCMTHVQNPAEIEHVAGDVSKNGAEVNMLYAELPDPVWRTLAGVAFSEKQLHAFADATHALRTQQPAPAGFVPVAAFDRLHAQAESLAARLLAAPQQEVQEPYGGLYDWTHSSATGKPDTSYTDFTKDFAHAQKHDNCIAVYTAQQPAPSAAAAAFDEHGFRDWVLRNLPKGSIIGNGEWWADHLTSWAKRFIKAAPQPSPTPQADSVTAPAEESRCANCGKSAADSHERIADYPEEGEWFCSAQCKDQHDELDCPHLTHNGYRHPAESERLIACERALRSLAAWLSVGGFNAPTVDAKVFEEKIRWGIEHLLQATPPAQAADSVLDRARIREIFMAHGFTVKEGQTDLKQYVYDAAAALLDAARKQGGAT